MRVNERLQVGVLVVGLFLPSGCEEDDKKKERPVAPTSETTAGTDVPTVTETGTGTCDPTGSTPTIEEPHDCSTSGITIAEGSFDGYELEASVDPMLYYAYEWLMSMGFVPGRVTVRVTEPEGRELLVGEFLEPGSPDNWFRMWAARSCEGEDCEYFVYEQFGTDLEAMGLDWTPVDVVPADLGAEDCCVVEDIPAGWDLPPDPQPCMEPAYGTPPEGGGSILVSRFDISDGEVKSELQEAVEAYPDGTVEDDVTFCDAEDYLRDAERSAIVILLGHTVWDDSRTESIGIKMEKEWTWGEAPVGLDTISARLGENQDGKVAILIGLTCSSDDWFEYGGNGSDVPPLEDRAACIVGFTSDDGGGKIYSSAAQLAVTEFLNALREGKTVGEAHQAGQDKFESETNRINNLPFTQDPIRNPKMKIHCKGYTEAELDGIHLADLQAD